MYSTYVHFDALYQAYLNACLWLLAEGVPFDGVSRGPPPTRRTTGRGFSHVWAPPTC